MSKFHFLLKAAVLMLVALGVAFTSGCTTTTNRGGSALSKSGFRPMGTSEDVATASDESDVRKRARIRLELATAYFAQGQLTTALDELKHVLSIDDNMSEGYELRGLIYSAMNEPGLADESYRRAIQLDARNGSALHNYAWWLCTNQKYPEADSLFERAINLPQSVVVSKTLMARGVCQVRAGLLPEAEKTLIKSYELDVTNPATAFNLAQVLYRRGEYDRSRFYIRRVNSIPEQMTPESVWLGVRVENRLANTAGRDELAGILRSRFPNSKEATVLELGHFDD